jgi:carboxyl-terminal processing protease
VHVTARTRRWLATAVAACLVVVPAPAAAPATALAAPPAPTPLATPCAMPSGPPVPVTPTTVNTIGQAYRCLLDHYVGGPALDDRVLLTAAFAGLAQELARRGLDRPDATAPALAGDRVRDWTAFRAAYQRLTDRLPADPQLRQAVAAATITGLVAGLHDDHAGWLHPVLPLGYQPGQAYGLGFATSPLTLVAMTAPDVALPPLFIAGVQGGPAAAHGLRPGDVIVAVDGAPPFVDGTPSPGAIALLSQQYPRADPVRLTVHRPATGRTWTVTLTPALYSPAPAAITPVTARIVAGDIADVRLAAFAPGAADRVLAAVADLRRDARLRGFVLDLRGNAGGAPSEVARLLGGFVHDRTWSYECDAADSCTANRTDDTVPPVDLPLVVLTDRSCASACDAFSAAVKDLHLGTLVGTRTAGIVSGPATGYLLDDNSLLRIPTRHQKGAAGEIVDGIGVPPDVQLPQTARDLSTGHDPNVAAAIALLRHGQHPGGP